MISPERCFAPSAPPPPATHSTDLDGDLAAVTCYFNPCGYRLRREHYERFAENLDRQGVPLYTIELTIRDQPAALGHYPNVRVLRSDHVLWHKERLLNLLIRSLPSRFDKVAWIDADVLLQDPDWPARVQEVLRRVPIAQLFTELLLLDRDGHPFSKRLGVASAAKRGHPSSHNLGHFHPGMAWAARRQLIDRHGLLDNHVLGGADSIMVCSMFGWWDHSLVRVYHPPLQQAMLRWGEILIFLDGHCHVDPESLRRLVDDVRRVGDSAIITPTVATLDTARWRCSQTNLGHGYFLDLERLSCG